MRIEFDTGNAVELLAVATLIEVLRGDLPATLADQGRPPFSPPPPPAVVPAAVVVEVAPDPAEAFGGISAEQAFAGAPDAGAPSGGATAGAAPPPPPVAAPVPPPPPATPPAGVEVDAKGLPWDKRIHSSPPAKNKADDMWRRKRGLDDAVEAQVVAELRQAMAAPPAPLAASGVVPAAPPPPPSTVPIASPPTPAPANTASGPDAAAVAPSPPPPPPAPVTPPPPPAAGPVTTFADLMRKITGMQTAGQLTIEQSAQISTALGITGVRDLMHRPDLIPSFDALLPVAA